MKRAFLTVITAIMAFAVPGPTFGQAQFSSDQRAKIKEYVYASHGAPVTIIDRPVVGAKLPASVPLTPVPNDWGRSATKFNFVLTPVPADWSPSGTTYRVSTGSNQVVIVEPSTRRVVEIVKQ